jgi:hypothetical protein
MKQDNEDDPEQKQKDTHAEDVPIVADRLDRAPAERIGEDQSADNPKKHKWADKWMVRLTAGLVLFAAVSAAVGYLQWTSISGQLDEMRNSNRAWIGPVGDPILPQPDTTDPSNPKISTGVILKNTGKSPATQMRTGIYGVFLPKEQELPDSPYYPNAPQEKGSPVLQPDAIYTILTGVPANKEGLDYIGKVKHGDDYWYIYGWVSYDDIYGHHRCTHFCEYFKQDLANAWACKKYNNVDQEPCRPNSE